MKKLMTGIVILFLALTTASAQTLASPTHQTWVLKITPESKKDYLDSVANAWEAHQITLKFSTLKYNLRGKLKKIKGSIVAGPGKGTASGTFKFDKLQSLEIIVTDPPTISIYANNQHPYSYIIK